jgi:hypothetical protein
MVGALFAVIAPMMSASAQSRDPVAGTWVLNLAKSTYSPGPAPKSLTRTYVATKKGYTYTAKGVGADGKATLVTYTASYDGKDHKMTGNPDADMISVKKIDATSTEATLKKHGKVMSTSTRTISADGKVLTSTAKGTNAKGQTVNNVLVFDKK